MRLTSLIAALGAVVLIAACSRSDDHSVTTASDNVAHNADVRKAEAEFKKAGRDAAKDFRKLAAEAKVETHKLAADTRNAGHDVAHDDHDRSDGDHSGNDKNS
jgi:hypothetical protein